ncbi:MAG: transketolase, partial [Patescibacteria group bacterium]|nr:transketolase [Patescibacteria group bacterium]
PTSCMSAADLMTVLFDEYYTDDLQNPHNLANDRLIFSKGHAAPLFYTLYALAGAFPVEELKTLRKITSRLEGHPTPEFPYTEAATGSLGQGLSVGAGLATGIRREEKLINKPKVYVLMGDGELAEGQVWEAANFAGYYKLDNLIAIADINRLGQSQQTMFGHNTEEYAALFKAFGWEVVVINGHDMIQVQGAFKKAVNNTSGKPFAIIAQTDKGHGVSFLQDHDNWHGKPLPKDKLEEALKELGDVKDEVVFHLRTPKSVTSSVSATTPKVEIPFKPGDQVATREVYGKVMAEIGSSDKNVVLLDAEVKNSTYSIDFMKAFPERFVECFIAEQNMVSVAAGLARFGKKPFVSTFAAFFTRAADQIRMAWLSKANIKFVGSHAGVSIGEDGASQMGLEEISMFGTLPDVVVLQPSDGVSASKLLAEFAQYEGMGYMQTLRPKTSVLYEVSDTFKIGGSKVLRQSEKDVLTIVATGIAVPEALKAAEMLLEKNIAVRVVDAYSLSPIDKKTLLQCVQETKKNVLITVEDHFIHGGLGDFVLAAVAEENVHVEKMAVTGHSHSGTGAELLHKAGIDADCIVKKVKSLLQ